jgi:hypothetical protein
MFKTTVAIKEQHWNVSHRVLGTVVSQTVQGTVSVSLTVLPQTGLQRKEDLHGQSHLTST